MKHVRLMTALLALFVCAGCSLPQSTISETSGITLTAMPEQTLSPTLTQTTAVEKLFDGCADDGFSNIGTVRGNTNGSLAVSGRAVCSADTIYYLLPYRFWGVIRLSAYDIKTGATTELLNKQNADVYSLEMLNLLHDSLYFVVRNFNAPDEIWRYSLSDNTVQILYQTSHIWFLLAAYDKLFFTDGSGRTVVMDVFDANSVAYLDDFKICGAMDGLLYGRASQSGRFVAIDNYGAVQTVFTEIERGIPIAGSIVDLDNTGGEPLDHYGTISIYQLDSDTLTVFAVPSIRCASYYNVTPDWIYIQRYGEDESGDIYRMQWDGSEFSLFDTRIFYSGMTLWGDQLLIDYVPCDDAWEASQDSLLP